MALGFALHDGVPTGAGDAGPNEPTPGRLAVSLAVPVD